MKKEFVELFENSRNPIEDDKVIEEIASSYIRDGWFYDEIVKIGADDKKTQEYPIQDMNILYSTLFNIWKKNILEMTNNTEGQQVFEGYYYDIVRDLQKLPNIHTYKEFCNINEKYPLIKKYGMLYPDSCWTYLLSRYINGTRKKDMQEKYRLYINAEGKDLLKIVSSFIYKCYENELPFDLKFVKYAEDLPERADRIVIWADEATLFEYLQILNEIQEKRKDIIARCNRPPILTMPINDWIGFGEEPPETSYTDYRMRILRESVEKAILNWIVENENTKITYGNSRFSVKQYMTAKSVKEGVERIKEEFNRAPQRAPQRYGINKNELNNELCIKICQSITEKIIPVLESGERKIEYKDGKQKLTFYFKSSIEDICNMLIKSPNSNKAFFQSIRDNIKEESEKYGISSKNFAFSKEFEKEIVENTDIER